jgi:hypothetical protein
VYDEYGVDDIGSMVDFMLSEEKWTGGGASAINTKGDLVDIPMNRAKLIQHIEENNLERKLKIIVGRVWNDIELSLKPKRKPKYA